MPILFRLQDLVPNLTPMLPRVDERSTACANSAIAHWPIMSEHQEEVDLRQLSRYLAFFRSEIWLLIDLIDMFLIVLTDEL